jgi:hypothetical protein
LKETIGDDSMYYGGFADKETRRKIREKATGPNKGPTIIEPNPE